jgi:hypothetical protein
VLRRFLSTQPSSSYKALEGVVEGLPRGSLYLTPLDALKRAFLEANFREPLPGKLRGMRHLRASLAVVQEWMQVARASAEPGELSYRAKY